LDILEENACRATFCVVGNRLDTRTDMIRRAFELGCEIFGHSWDHRDFTKLKAETIRLELRDTSAAIEAITGFVPMLYRPPKGAYNDKVKGVSAELGYSIINWSVDSRDWSSKDADKIYKAIMSDVCDRSIVLCHDLYATTVEAMERVIPDLIAEGYQLVTVSELMYYSDITLKPGKLYRSGN
jgi:peptidoglycan/xylan/chitin deacetylase (PgdA/CDA1 family)